MGRFVIYDLAMSSAWRHKSPFTMSMREFSSDFGALLEDVQSAYKLPSKEVYIVEVRPYDDFIAWAIAQDPDWDRYAWNGTRVLVERGLLPKSAAKKWDNPNLKDFSISIDEWLYLGFEDYIESLAKSIDEGKNVMPLVAVEGAPIDGRHRTLAARKLRLKNAPIINLTVD